MRAVVAGHLAAARRGVAGRRVLRGQDVAGAHPERQARRDRAVERGDPVLALLERPGDPDLGPLVALAADHERDPAGPVEDPHPLVDGPGQRDEAVHLEEVVVGQADRVAEVTPRLARGRGLRRHRHQKLIDLPSTAIAASPRTSLSVGWGWVDAADLPRRRLELERDRRLGDEVRGVRPDDVDAERVVGLLVGDDLREALVLADDDRLGDRLERDLADLDVEALLLGLLLGQPDRGDLRPAVGRPRLLHVVDRVDVLLAGDDVGRDDALVAGGVGEHEAADGVADRVEVRLARPHPAVDLDEPLLDLGLRRLEADLLDVRGPAGRDEHHLGPELLLLLALRPDLEADPVLRDLDLRGVEAGVGHDRDPAPA